MMTTMLAVLGERERKKGKEEIGSYCRFTYVRTYSYVDRYSYKRYAYVRTYSQVN